MRNNPDLITAKLGALQFYQLAIPAPTPPKRTFDKAAAARGKELFKGTRAARPAMFRRCSPNRVGTTHAAEEIGIDDFQANRAPDRRYRTSPLKGVWTHQKGGFYHDGRFATLRDVVNHYNEFLGLGLSRQEKSDLVEYLKSL